MRHWASLVSIRVQLAGGLLTGILVVAAATVAPSESMITFDGVSDSVVVEVHASDLASFGLRRAWDTRSQTCLSNVLVTPRVRAQVRYRMHASGRLSVFVEGGVAVSSEGREEVAANSAELLVSSRDTCQVDEDVRLPANGGLRIGTEFQVVTARDFRLPVLRRGLVQVYGRSIRAIAGVPLHWGPFSEGSLYKAGELTVPAGSVVENAVVRGEGKAAWWGYAYAPVVSAPAEGLTVSASTNASAVPVYLPAPYMGTQHSLCVKAGNAIGSLRPECVALGLGTKLGVDPSLRLLYGIVVALGALGAAVALCGSVYRAISGGSAHSRS